MKKAYTKPELFCEEYELSVSIAGNCGIEMRAHQTNQSSWQTCGFKMGADYVFVNDNCNIDPEDDGDNGICYQQPFAEHLVFSS